MDLRIVSIIAKGASTMNSAKAIANYFLDKSIDLTPMKIIKLVYIAHGWHLAITDKPLIEDYVQAWEFGPVIPDLYHEFKKYGNTPIKTYAKGDYGDYPEIMPEAKIPSMHESASIKYFLDTILGFV